MAVWHHKICNNTLISWMFITKYNKNYKFEKNVKTQPHRILQSYLSISYGLRNAEKVQAPLNNQSVTDLTLMVM